MPTRMMFDATQLVIGEQKQYFFDDLLIETVENVRRTFHSPEKVGTEPLVRKDKPWEHVPYFSCNNWQMIRDPKDNLFKLWYSDWAAERAKPGEILTGGCMRILYAQSEDGVHWTKPALGMETIDGHDTNVVLGGNGYQCLQSRRDTRSLRNGPESAFQRSLHALQGRQRLRPDGLPHLRRWDPLDTRVGRPRSSVGADRDWMT